MAQGVDGAMHNILAQMHLLADNEAGLAYDTVRRIELSNSENTQTLQKMQSKLDNSKAGKPSNLPYDPISIILTQNRIVMT